MPIGGQVNINQVTPGEYKFFMGLYKTLYIASATATAIGLTGLAINHFIDPEEASDLVRKVLSHSDGIAFGGGLFTLYFGLNYHANRLC